MMDPHVYYDGSMMYLIYICDSCLGKGTLLHKTSFDADGEDSTVLYVVLK